MNIQNMAQLFPYKTTVPEHDGEHSKSYFRALKSPGGSGSSGKSWEAPAKLW